MKSSHFRKFMLSSSLLGASVLGLGSGLASAQQASQQGPQTDSGDLVVVTGTRIQAPGVESSSPISTIGAEELAQQNQSQVERILRVLPISVPGDGENTNNGTAGVATVNLRGLGAQRNLIMIDGKRVTPYNVAGAVDVSTIPTAMLERVDIITGGASATYGSDAISGAVNFVLKRDFEGIQASTKYSVTGDDDGQTYDANLALGANFGDGRGNVAMNLSYAKREGIQFGQRDYSRVGVSSATGSGLGITGGAEPANCSGENTVPTTFGGSGTTLPARLIVPGGNLQFRNDGTLGPNCNQFNFNPYNYYQTPSERFGGVAYGHYEINENVEAYGRMMFSATNVRQQIAPSGIFNTPLLIPLQSPFLNASARTTLVNQLEAQRAAGNLTLSGANQNWFDNNSNGVVDAADTVRLGVGRRTVEFGERSTTYDNNAFQMLFGFRGDLFAGWNWDTTFSHGEVDRTNIAAGYTNVTNATIAVNTISATECRTATGVLTAGCVPLNLFGPQGSITPAMAAYSSATGIEQQAYTQTYAQASVSGPVAAAKTPFSQDPLQLAFGVEYREENGKTTPDECLKLAPSSCLGGAGGNTLPISGGFSVNEVFGEALFPIVTDQPFAQNVGLELGYRYADYDPSGKNDTWKAGINWEFNNELRARFMAQRAARAPSVNELSAPRRSGLDNATRDPCSVANAANNGPGTALRAQCIATGMTAAQVGTAPDIVAGQINVFIGTNTAALPEPEVADTLTYGFVYRPSWVSFLTDTTLSVDYYSIDIDGFIGRLPAQDVLDGCYISASAADCALIVRQAGNLIFPGSGIVVLTQNLVNAKSEGIDVNFSAGLELETVGLENWGQLSFTYAGTFSRALEFQTNAASRPKDCLGFYGNACDPLTGGNPAPEYKHATRVTWDIANFQSSLLWRRIGETAILPAQASATFAPFRTIKAYDYFDIVGSYDLTDNFQITAGVINIANKNPPIRGNDVGPTSSNGGNTFPQTYDSIGRVFSIGGRVQF